MGINTFKIMHKITEEWNIDVVGKGRSLRRWDMCERQAIVDHMKLNLSELELNDEAFLQHRDAIINAATSRELQDAVDDVYNVKLHTRMRLGLIKYLSARNREELGGGAKKKYKMVSVLDKTKDHFDHYKRELGYAKISNSEFLVDLVTARDAVETVMNRMNLSFDDAIGFISSLGQSDEE